MEIFDDHGNELLSALLSMRTPEELKRFLTDLCTIQEIQSMSQRYQVAKLLKIGRTYDHISEETGASKATISRVNRSLVWGAGGYKDALERGEKETQEETK